MAETTARKRPRQVVGEVVSTAMNKTITVQVMRLVKHPVFGKYIRKTTRYFAHDERVQAKVGDVVEILPSRPISRLKRWRLHRILAGRGGGS